MSYRDYVNTRVLINYDEFNSTKDDPVLLCTNVGVLGVIRVLLSTYGYRTVNWVKTYYDQGYDTPNDNEKDTYEKYLSAFLEETDDMTYCEDIVTALNNIAASVCCGGGTGAGSAGGSPQTPSTFEDDNANLPPGFPGIAEYKVYKCKAANAIFDMWRQDLVYLTTASISDITLATLIQWFISPISVTAMTQFVAFLYSLALQAVLGSTAQGIIDELDAHQTDVVCELYQATDYTQAQAATVTIRDSILSLTTVESALFDYMFTSDLLNYLFQNSSVVAGWSGSSSVDCLSCIDPDCPALGIKLSQTDWLWINPVVGAQYTLNSHQEGGYQYCIFSNIPPKSGCSCNMFMATLGGNPSNLYGSATRYCDGTYHDIGNLTGIVGVSTQMAQVVSIHTQVHTITLTFDGWL